MSSSTKFYSVAFMVTIAVFAHSALTQVPGQNAMLPAEVKTINTARGYFPMKATCCLPSMSFAGSSESRSPVSNGSGGATNKKISTATDLSVFAETSDPAVTEGYARVATSREIESSAGTFGDPSRFIQTLAGVGSANDQRNDFLVRGGNPSENLFVIDNIEVPSINQLALSDTTGGLFSMLDSEGVQGITLHTDAYDDRFDQRLSSVIEVSTVTNGPVTRHTTMEAGIAGLGGSTTRPLGNGGSLFLSAREGVLQYVTNDIGMNGVPHYQNAMARAQYIIDDSNSWWGMSLTGIDSLKISPSAGDAAETNPYDITYSGWRNTTGLNWQHLYSAHAFGVASLAHAAQHQSVGENAQLQSGSIVYNENTTDEISTAKYDFLFQPNESVTLTAGGRASVDQLNYAVAQPVGLQNPYSQNPAPLDTMALARKFAPVSSAAYLQATFNFAHDARLVLGERGEQWALGGHSGATSKALFAIPILGKLTHIGYAEYQQLPPTLYLLSFNNLQNLQPVRSRQLTAGTFLANNSRARVTLELYQKQYFSYPVASDYPQLSLANIADTFGQAFLMVPMVGKGAGLNRGAELTIEGHVTSRISLTGTITYARSLYSGLDAVLRRGNYDVPLQANVTGVWRMGRDTLFSWRYTATSGTPYTPDNLPLSYAQDRDVYDLTQVNALRSQAYSRLDFRLEQSRKIGAGVMTWHAGLENALNTKNFYCYAWEPRWNWGKGGPGEQDQMPIFPDGGVKYSF